MLERPIDKDHELHGFLVAVIVTKADLKTVKRVCVVDYPQL